MQVGGCGGVAGLNHGGNQRAQAALVSARMGFMHGIYARNSCME